MRPLIVYGAGLNLDSAVKTFLEQGRTLACIVDGDVKKHGLVKLWGEVSLEILSLETAVARFDSPDFYITPNPPVKFEIMDKLQEFGVLKEQILNFEPYEKIYNCYELNNNLTLDKRDVRFCCVEHITNIPKIPLSDNTTNEDLWKKTIAIRQEAIKNIRNYGKDRDFCKNCYRAEEKYICADKTKTKIETLNVIVGFVCQYNCCYCVHEHQPLQERLNYTKRALNFANYLYENGILDGTTNVAIVNGEISINPMIKEILATFCQSNLQILTNGAVYSTEIEDVLKKGRTTLNISLDAGTQETFRYIKNKNGVANFDVVCDNIRRYASYGPVQLKYILLLGKNDNLGDIEGFLNFASQIKADNIILSRDSFNLADLESDIEKTLQIIRYFRKGAIERSLRFCGSHHMVIGKYGERIAHALNGMEE
ncbi:MAG: radical SAM protein [Turicibacter sp.]|nr:radical SAM protein [Turicibacter sp.]